MKRLLGALFVLLFLWSSSCVFGPSTKRVMSYRYHNVYLAGKHDYYNVGALSAPWRRFRVKAYTIAFYNPDVGASISTDAFCGPGYEDSPLATLTSQLFAGVEDYKIVERIEFVLDGRGALRTTVAGSVDGVPLSFDIVVVKKNKCNIDFMCVAPQGSHSRVATDFETFFSGFHYE